MANASARTAGRRAAAEHLADLVAVLPDRQPEQAEATSDQRRIDHQAADRMPRFVIVDCRPGRFGRSKHALGRRARPAARVGLAGRPEGAGQPLEDRLADVVGVPPVMQEHVQVQPALGGERLPEVGHELAVERADLGRRASARSRPRTAARPGRRRRSRASRPSARPRARSGGSRRGRRGPGRAPARGRCPRPRSCGGRRRAGRPCTSTVRSINECRANSSSMWSRKPTPVATSDRPWPSRSRTSRMSVSRVLRTTSAVRAPGGRLRAHRGSTLRSCLRPNRGHQTNFRSSPSNRSISWSVPTVTRKPGARPGYRISRTRILRSLSA